MPPNRCAIISANIGKMLDNSMMQELDLQPTSRTGKTVPPGGGGYWRTRDGFLVSEVGPNYTPLETSERLSLIGKVNSYGRPGEWLASTTDLHQRQVDIHASSDTQGIRKFVEALTDEEKSNLVQVIERRLHDVDETGAYVYERGSRNVQPVNERVGIAAQMVKEYFEARKELAEKIGIEGFRALKDYFPELYKTDTIRTDEYRRRAIEGLAKKIAKGEGRATPASQDYASAKSVFELYIGPQYAKVAANLQKMRFLDRGEGRILDPLEVINNYAHQFWHAYYKKAIFGENAKGHPEGFPLKIAQAIGEIEKLALDGKLPIRGLTTNVNALMNQVNALVRDTFGIHPHDPVMNSQIVRTLGALQTLKLSMSVFKNSSQHLNTAFKTDFRSVAKAIGALAFNSEVTMGIGAREYAGMMASVIDNAVYESTLYQGTGIVGKMGENVLKYTGFTGVEKFNRAVAGLAGSFYADRQAKMLVQTGKTRYATALRELGINPETVQAQAGQLTPEQMLLAGQRVINSTQFRSRQSDLPFFTTQNPGLWRLLLQFRTFTFNQSKLVVDAYRKNPARLALFGIGVMPLAGMGVNFVEQGLKRGVFGVEPKEQNGITRYLEGATSAGSFGLVSDMLYNFASGNNIASYAVPPSFRTLDDAVMIAGNAVRGDFEGVARGVGRQFGGLGSAFVKGQFDEQ